MADATKTPTVEEVKNCPTCKKPLKKSRRYYRNGSYYCNHNCFKKAQATAIAAAKAEADAAASVPAEGSKG